MATTTVAPKVEGDEIILIEVKLMAVFTNIKNFVRDELIINFEIILESNMLSDKICSCSLIESINEKILLID